MLLRAAVLAGTNAVIITATLGQIISNVPAELNVDQAEFRRNHLYFEDTDNFFQFAEAPLINLCVCACVHPRARERRKSERDAFGDWVCSLWTLI